MTNKTAVATAAPTLSSPVEILGEPNAHGYVAVRTLGGGVGGWAEAGKVLSVRVELLSDVREAPRPAPVAPLTEVVDGERYILVLLERQAAWKAAHPAARVFPLLDWFVRDEDVPYVRLPEPAAKPARAPRKPRTYRSAQSLRDERDRVAAEMDRVAGVDSEGDRAQANLSPFSRSKAAARAGRQRFERLDRDLERYAQLRRRRDQLDSRIVAAETREGVVPPRAGG